ncbi:MAG: hypothetical protein R2778_18895 [Saprospiraceae bacterium]
MSSTRHLQLLAQDLRMHPERYTSVKVKLFGKNKPKKYANPLEDPFIQTEDLGRVYEDGRFEVIGRLDAAELRGCNLMVNG